jgi:hypothetical protein
MSELRFEVRQSMPVSGANVWSVLGDFGNEHRWTRSLTHCERTTTEVSVGTARICTLPRPLMGRTKVREELTEFNPRIALTYVLDGAAGPFRTASSRWSMRELSPNETEVTVEGRFSPKNALVQFLLWPIAKPFIARLTRSVLAELEVFVTQATAQVSSPRPG